VRLNIFLLQVVQVIVSARECCHLFGTNEVLNIDVSIVKGKRKEGALEVRIKKKKRERKKEVRVVWKGSFLAPIDFFCEGDLLLTSLIRVM